MQSKSVKDIDIPRLPGLSGPEGHSEKATGFLNAAADSWGHTAPPQHQ